MPSQEEAEARAATVAAARLANRDQFPPPVTVLRSGGEALRGHAGPLEYRPETCQALVEDGTQSCAVRATWRVTAASVGEVSDYLQPNPPGDSWLVCQPHLGETIMLVNDTYGAPVLVTRHV